MSPISRLIVVSLCITFGLVNAARAELHVAVSIPPQAYFVETIGGAHVDVQVMVPANAEPVTYEPTARQMSALSRATLYFATGVPFEKAWLPRFRNANPAMTVIDTNDRIQRRAMASHDGHAHGEPDTPKQAALDPHVWLSPPLVRLQAEAIRDALVAADPAHAADYHRGFRRLAGEVHALDRDILDALTGIAPSARRFLVFHPAFGYFAASYGLEQMAIEVEGKEPGPRELARIIDSAREHGIRVIFIEPQFAQGAARTIAREIGGQVVTLDPLAHDWPGGMRAIADTLAETLGGAPSKEATPAHEH